MTDADSDRVSDAFSRRSVIELAGITASSALLAGCGGGGDDPEDAPAEPGEGDRDNVDDQNTTDEEEGDGAGGGEDGGEEQIDDWEHVTAFFFEAHIDGWQGVEPALVEGEENPSITLYEGIEYEFGWENADDAPHNLAFWDENEEIVDDYESEIVESEGETQTVTVEASEEMTNYVCGQHPDDMMGEIEIETDHERESGDVENQSDGGNESGGGDGNESDGGNESEDDGGGDNESGD